MTGLPYGAWPSPITAELLVADSVGLSDLDVVEGGLVWSELRPTEQGRCCVVRWCEGADPVDLVPAPFSARSGVHEYGGAAFVVAGDTCFFVNFADQAIWSVTDGDAPIQLTEEVDPVRSVRFGDLVIDRARRTLFAVRERHGVGGVGGAAGVVNDLVAVATDGSSIRVVASGHDFYAAPRLAPDGRRLVFVVWDNPNMPWDDSALYSIDLDAPGEARLIAGLGGESISQPRFSPDGALHYLSDRSGFTSLYREDGSVVVEIDADLGGPDWVFGQSSYAFSDNGRVVVAVETPRGSQLVAFDGKQRTPIGTEFDVATSVRAFDGGIAAIVGSASQPSSITTFDGGARSRRIRQSQSLSIDDAYFSSPEPITVITDTREIYALFYRPTNPDSVGVDGARPPLVVVSHGGPTARTTAAFNLRVQYFTSRGIAVVDVNYGGSSGFGRAYRQRLDRLWGVVDVEDCAAVAVHLADEGRVDRSRLAIRGGSAGGYTTLAALAFTDVFAVGASAYGVSDLVALADDTHKFEARYLDRLVGPLPRSRAIYDARSPLRHADQIDCPVIFFQGLDDAVVPPAQSEVLVEALRARKVPVAYMPIAGEGHGFRRSESIVAVTEAELSFFGAVLGFTPADRLAPVTIENASQLVRRGSG